MDNCKFCMAETTLCASCGEFNIMEALKETLEKLGKKPHEILVVGATGQAAQTLKCMNANVFCGIHGRSLPPAAAAKIVNKDLTVIIDTSDMDSYIAGGNHFIHNIRRNTDITHIVHDNQTFEAESLNPVLLAISSGASFVARAYSEDREHLVSILLEAINYKGYALVDILKSCPKINKINTTEWYDERVYKLDVNYDYTNKLLALEKSMEWGDRIPVGIIYRKEKSDYTSKTGFLREGPPLVDRVTDMEKVKRYMKEFM